MISTTTSSITYTGNASTTTGYAIPFPFVAAANIAAFTTSAAGVVTTLVYGTDYTVTPTVDVNGRNTAGTLKTLVAVAATLTLTIRRVTPATQTTDLVSGGRLSAEALESALDTVTMIAQEAVRDALGGGETNVEVSGTGLVAQTAAAVYAARAIVAAADMGLVVTNGDGVSGNPSLSMDDTLLTAVTTVDAADIFRVKTASGYRKITGANLLAVPTAYRTVSIPMSAAYVAGGASGITLSAQHIAFTNTATGSAVLNFTLPDDFSGGAVRVKLNAFVNGGSISDQYRMTVAAYANLQGSSTVGALVSSVVGQDLNHSATDSRTPAFELTGLEAGKHYALFLTRDTANAWDTVAADVRVVAFHFQYLALATAASW